MANSSPPRRARAISRSPKPLPCRRRSNPSQVWPLWRSPPRQYREPHSRTSPTHQHQPHRPHWLCPQLPRPRRQRRQRRRPSRRPRQPWPTVRYPQRRLHMRNTTAPDGHRATSHILELATDAAKEHLNRCMDGRQCAQCMLPRSPMCDLQHKPDLCVSVVLRFVDATDDDFVGYRCVTWLFCIGQSSLDLQLCVLSKS